MTDSLQEFLGAAHDELDALFLAHQEALLDRDVDEAKARLRTYRRRLVLHMRHEDEHLLPVYDRTEQPAARAVSVFALEHRKIHEHLDAIEGTLGTLSGTPPAAAVIALLDREAVFKSLMAHHDLRERNVLYPAIERILGEEERRKLLEVLWAEWGG